MPIMLPKTFQFKRKLKKVKRSKPIRPSRRIRKSYEDALLDLIDTLKAQTRLISAMFLDGGTQSQLMSYLRQIQKKAQSDFENAADDVAKGFVDSLSDEHRERYDNTIKLALGVEFASVVDSQEMVEYLNEALASNVQLIETIPQQHYDKVAKAIRDNFNGDLPQGLPRRLQEIGGITEGRARFIARDQTASLTSDITKKRNESAGFSRYTWRTAQDSRVVGAPGGKWKPSAKHGDHYDREGKVYTYSNPPKDGHAGKPINCRCYQEPLIDLDELDAMYI